MNRFAIAAVSLLLSLAAPSAFAAFPGAPTCQADPMGASASCNGADPTGTCGAQGRFRSGVGYWALKCHSAAAPVDGSDSGSADPASLALNETPRGQVSESGMVSYRESNGTFHCDTDGCALSSFLTNDTLRGVGSPMGSLSPYRESKVSASCSIDSSSCRDRWGWEGAGGSARGASNVTWIVDSTPPTAAYNITLDGDGDGSPDTPVSADCAAQATSDAPCGAGGLRWNSTGFFDITYRAGTVTVAAADLDGNGAPDVASSAGCAPVSAAAPPACAPWSNATFAVTYGRDKLKGTTRMANGTAAADLDGDGLATLVLGGNGSTHTLTVFALDRVYATCDDGNDVCQVSTLLPGGEFFAYNNGEESGAFASAAGASHGCKVKHDMVKNSIGNCR